MSDEDKSNFLPKHKHTHTHNARTNHGERKKAAPETHTHTKKKTIFFFFVCSFLPFSPQKIWTRRTTGRADDSGTTDRLCRRWTFSLILFDFFFLVLSSLPPLVRLSGRTPPGVDIAHARVAEERNKSARQNAPPSHSFLVARFTHFTLDAGKRTGKTFPFCHSNRRLAKTR